jgi:hypothetical protein
MMITEYGDGIVLNVGTSEATHAIAGRPGRLEPAGASFPTTQEGFDALVPVPADWPLGDYIVASDYYTGQLGATTFIAGQMTAYSPVEVPGGAATIFSPAGWVPPDLVTLNRMHVLPTNADGLPAPWVEGSYLECANGDRVFWNGSLWVLGEGSVPAPAPDEIRAIIGDVSAYYLPPEAPLPTAAELTAMRPASGVFITPMSPWPVAWEFLTADAKPMSWNGSEWVEKPAALAGREEEQPPREHRHLWRQHVRP